MLVKQFIDKALRMLKRRMSIHIGNKWQRRWTGGKAWGHWLNGYVLQTRRSRDSELIAPVRNKLDGHQHNLKSPEALQRADNRWLCTNTFDMLEFAIDLMNVDAPKSRLST